MQFHPSGPEYCHLWLFEFLPNSGIPPYNNVTRVRKNVFHRKHLRSRCVRETGGD